MKKLSERQIFERSLTEEDVLCACRQLLEVNGARVHRIVERIPWGKRTSTPGMPDLLGWFCRVKDDYTHPYFVLPFFIEVKRPGGKHRPSQTAWIEAARADGVIAFFADSVEAMVKGFSDYGIRIKGV